MNVGIPGSACEGRAGIPCSACGGRVGTRALPFANLGCPFGANDLCPNGAIDSSANGATHTSPGHRPGSSVPQTQPALKGRPIP